MADAVHVTIVNPNIKVLRSSSPVNRNKVVLVIDAYNGDTQQSVIVKIEMPEEQADAWSRVLKTPD